MTWLALGLINVQQLVRFNIPFIKLFQVDWASVEASNIHVSVQVTLLTHTRPQNINTL